MACLSPPEVVLPLLDTMFPTYAPEFTWPEITGPGGLPNFALSGFFAMTGGINFVLDFLPIDPENLPSLPTIDIFLAPFEANLNIPTLPDFDPTAYLALGTAVVQVAFDIIIEIVNGIINNLSLEFPSIGTIEGLLIAGFGAVGLVGPALPNLALAIATGFFDMITSCLV